MYFNSRYFLESFFTYYTYFPHRNIQSWFYMFYYSFCSVKELYESLHWGIAKTETFQTERFHLNPHMSYQLKCHTTQTHLAHKVLKRIMQNSIMILFWDSTMQCKVFIYETEMKMHFKYILIWNYFSNNTFKSNTYATLWSKHLHCMSVKWHCFNTK